MSELILPSPASFVEVALVRPEATRQDMEGSCADARRHGCRGVCVAGSHVLLACSLLDETPLKVTALVGFPLGTMDADVKRFETETAIDHGAHEIEAVLNLGRLKDKNTAGVLRELRDLAEAADERPVKVLLDTRFLSPEEIALACELALDSGVHGIVVGAPDAALDQIKRVRALVGNKFIVKATGGMGTRSQAQALLEAGASRLGLTELTDWIRNP